MLNLVHQLECVVFCSKITYPDFEIGRYIGDVHIDVGIGSQKLTFDALGFLLGIHFRRKEDFNPEPLCFPSLLVAPDMELNQFSELGILVVSHENIGRLASGGVFLPGADLGKSRSSDQEKEKQYQDSFHLMRSACVQIYTHYYNYSFPHDTHLLISHLNKTLKKKIFLGEIIFHLLLLH